ncbi:hypothetical protein [Thermoanaerobacter sp. A7A]|uniref:hypothetical protein n=1 Tax=Thermoanaerobacter sp. A7A TaxID=1350366 RepID=UPI00040E707A|nr:hypothetical protein [Thermoanaerobacter sp. A7A]
MKLGELLLKATGSTPQTGNIKGVCVVCGTEVDNGIPLKECVSDNFTGWSYFFAGNCMCPECAYLFSDQTFRRKSWVALLHGYKVFKNDDAQQILFNPPDTPFFIHIAKTGQKQTWLTCIHRVAHNPHRYFFSHEKYDVPILFEHDRAATYIQIIAEAMAKGLTKTELTTCEFKMKTWQKAIESGYRDFLRELTKFKGDILWEVLVDVYRKAD